MGLALASSQALALSCGPKPNHHYPLQFQSAGSEAKIDAAFRDEAGQLLADYELVAAGVIEPDAIPYALGPRQHMRLVQVQLLRAFRLPPEMAEGERIQVLVPAALDSGELLLAARRGQAKDWSAWEKWQWQPQRLPDEFWDTSEPCVERALSLEDYRGASLVAALEQKAAQAQDPVLELTVDLPVKGIAYTGQGVRVAIDTVAGRRQLHVPPNVAGTPGRTRVTVPPGPVEIHWPPIEGLNFSCGRGVGGCSRFSLVRGALVRLSGYYGPDASVEAAFVDVLGVPDDVMAVVELQRVSTSIAAEGLLGGLQERWRLMPQRRDSQPEQSNERRGRTWLAVPAGDYSANLILGTNADGENDCSTSRRLPLLLKHADNEGAFVERVSLTPRGNRLHLLMPDAPAPARVELQAMRQARLVATESYVFKIMPFCDEADLGSLEVSTREPATTIRAFPGTPLRVDVYCTACTHANRASASIRADSDQTVVLDMRE